MTDGQHFEVENNGASSVSFYLLELAKLSTLFADKSLRSRCVTACRRNNNNRSASNNNATESAFRKIAALVESRYVIHSFSLDVVYHSLQHLALPLTKFPKTSQGRCLHVFFLRHTSLHRRLSVFTRAGAIYGNAPAPPPPNAVHRTACAQAADSNRIRFTLNNYCVR